VRLVDNDDGLARGALALNLSTSSNILVKLFLTGVRMYKNI